MNVKRVIRIIERLLKGMMPYGLVVACRSSYLDAYYRVYRHSKRTFKQYYNSAEAVHTPALRNNSGTKRIIYMADGRETCGGLSDRLRAMVSLYKIAQENNIQYNIHFTSPSELTHYLVPNTYDWRIDKSEIVYDVRTSAMYSLSCTNSDESVRIMLQLLKRYNQLHISTIIDICFADEYARYFNQLFKPSNELEELIEYHTQKIGCAFISATLRFQALLGDFYEGKYPSLAEHERKTLIQRCIDHLIEIHNENHDEKILVTSDSITFLHAIQDMNFVYVIPGEIAHIDYSLGLEKNIYMKSFVDYFLLTKSKKIYLIIDGQMRDSTFPYRASLHRNHYFIKRYT